MQDFLTGLLQEKKFKEMAISEITRARRYRRPISFIVIKPNLTDQEAKDIIYPTLKLIGKVVNDMIRSVDAAGRLQNSIILMLPETDHTGALILLDRIAERVILMAKESNTYQKKDLTISYGISVYADFSNTDSRAAYLSLVEEAKKDVKDYMEYKDIKKNVKVKREYALANLKDVDTQVFDAIQDEIKRQEFKLELIASENYVSLAVLQAQGSVLTNKYAEGYPGKRYYGGCEYVDIVENLAIQRAKEIFAAEYVNVQPHSGSQANMAAYFSLLKPGDTILSMSLASGGHLSHGAKFNFSGKLFNVVHYGVDKNTERINFQEVRQLAKEHKVKLIVAGASAYPRVIDFKKFKEIADEVGAYLMVDMAHIAGLVAAKLHPSPIEYADVVTTTTHKTLRGPRGGMIFSKKEHEKAIKKWVFPGIQGGPLMHVIAAKAVALKEAQSKDFVLYQEQVIKNAKRLADSLADRGLRIVSGGTDNHLMLVDLRPIDITGKEAEERLEAAGITVNKNAIPFDPQKPAIASGIRIGTPAVTTRGMKEEQMELIADYIYQVLTDKNSIEKVLLKVRNLCSDFKMYSDLLDNK